jgi:hypothetical protein
MRGANLGFGDAGCSAIGGVRTGTPTPVARSAESVTPFAINLLCRRISLEV